MSEIFVFCGDAYKYEYLNNIDVMGAAMWCLILAGKSNLNLIAITGPNVFD